MAFRNVIIESPARIFLKQTQLCIETDRIHSVAVEDLSAILPENRQSSITTAALSYLGQCGCAVFVCDEKQYESIDILFGALTSADEPFHCEQLSIF